MIPKETLSDLSFVESIDISYSYSPKNEFQQSISFAERFSDSKLLQIDTISKSPYLHHYFYDSFGKIVNDKYFNSDGVFSDEFQFFYNNDSNLLNYTETSLSNSTGKVTRLYKKYNCEYSADGRKIKATEQTFINSEVGFAERISTFEVDNKGRLIKKSALYPKGSPEEGKIANQVVYTYKDTSVIYPKTEELYVFEDGKLNLYGSASYDEFGRQIEGLSPPLNLKTTYNYLNFDNHKNWTKMTVTLKDEESGEQNMQIVERKIKYH